jgi:hypothetical protein
MVQLVLLFCQPSPNRRKTTIAPFALVFIDFSEHSLNLLVAAILFAVGQKSPPLVQVQ